MFPRIVPCAALTDDGDEARSRDGKCAVCGVAALWSAADSARCRQSAWSPNSALIHENAIVPPPITAHVATVRHRMSVPVNSQIARRQATTATRRHPLVVQKDSPRTIWGFRKPRLVGPPSECCAAFATACSLSPAAHLLRMPTSVARPRYSIARPHVEMPQSF